jgi:hypothetical protein
VYPGLEKIGVRPLSPRGMNGRRAIDVISFFSFFFLLALCV